VTPEGCGVHEEDLARILKAGSEAQDYARKLEKALERVRVAADLIEDDSIRDIIVRVSEVI